MARSLTGRLAGSTLAGVVGFLAFVELTSGVLQGYYTPMLTDIARHLGVHDADVNWLEGSQLMLSALVVPALAKLGDMVGHRRILLWSTAVTAAASLVLPFTDSFAVFLVAWAVQGFYVVWLPLEIALVWSRARRLANPAAVTARAAGVLVAALETGAIVGALAGGALVDALPLRVVLLVPALLVVVCFVVVLLGVQESPDPAGGRFDTVGLVLVSLALLALTGGLSLLRLEGVAAVAPWALVLLGAALLWPFARWELRQDDPLVDVRMFR
ncbi:MFS transporter, partial [Cellulosimicrobium sp. CpK407]